MHYRTWAAAKLIACGLPECARASREKRDGLAAAPYRYKIEVRSTAGIFNAIVDKRVNDTANNVEFDQLAPVRCRYVRLTIIGSPKGVPMGVPDFTVFGKSIETPGR